MTIEFLGWSPWLALLCALPAAWLALRLRRPEPAGLALRTRFALDALRVLAVAVLALALAEPALAWTSRRHEPPAVAIVIDRSGSMALADPHQDPTDRLDEAVALGLADALARPDAAMRAATLVRSAEIGPELAPMAESLASALDGSPALAAALRRYGASCTVRDAAGARTEAEAVGPLARRAQSEADAALIGAAGADSPLTRALARLATMPRRERAVTLARRLAAALPGAACDWFVLDERLVPVDGADGAAAALEGGRATDLGEGFAALARGWSGRGHPSAAILLTDGRRTAGADPEPAARALAARGVRLVAIGLGDPAPPAEPALGGLEGPDEVVAGEAVRLVATVRVPPGAGSWVLAWRRDGVELARTPVAAGAAWMRVPGEFAAAAGTVQTAIEVWEVRLEPADAVPGRTDPAPSATCAVAVSAAPPRILVLDASPRWELRHAIAALEGGLGARIDRRFRVTLGAGVPLLPPGDLTTGIDVVVLGDLPPAELGAEEQARLAAFVANRGGGLVVVSGPRAMPAAYGLGQLAALLPVRPGDPRGLPEPDGVALAGPSAGLVASEAVPAWDRLPALPWWVRSAVLRPGSDLVLSVQDRATSPLVVLGRHGAGRVAWLGSDQLWRWRSGGAHAQLWLRLVRWALGARLGGADRRLQMAVDRVVAAPGEAAVLRVRCDPALAKPGVVLERLDTAGTRHEIALEPLEGVAAAWSARVNDAAAPLAPGRWRLTASCADLEEQRDLLVRADPGRETLEPSLDRAALDRLAVAAGGTATGLAGVHGEIGRLAAGLSPHEIEVRRRLTPWDGPWWLLAVAALLVLEWAWRRRVGLP